MKVKEVIAMLQKYDPEIDIAIWDGGNFYDDAWKFNLMEEDIERDGTRCRAIVSLDLDEIIEEYWWVPTEMSLQDKLNWIATISTANVREPAKPVER